MTTVEVKQQHIENGRKFSPGKCPAALAIKSKIKFSVGILVGEVNVSFYPKPGESHHAVLPVEETWRIQNFDRNSFMEPHEFELDIPQECLS